MILVFFKFKRRSFAVFVLIGELVNVVKHFGGIFSPVIIAGNFFVNDNKRLLHWRIVLLP